MSRTRKPCPACGEAKGWRDANGICGACKRLIADGETYKAWIIKREAENEVRIVPADKPSWCWPYPYPGVLYVLSTEEKKMLRDTFAAIALLFVEDLPKSNIKYRENVLSLIRQQDNSHGWHFNAIFPKGIPAKLQALFDAIETALRATYKAGVQEGSNILKQLAEGKITVKKFNELTTESGVKG